MMMRAGVNQFSRSISSKKRVTTGVKYPSSLAVSLETSQMHVNKRALLVALQEPFNRSW